MVIIRFLSTSEWGRRYKLRGVIFRRHLEFDGALMDAADGGVPADKLKGWSVRFSPVHQNGGWAKLDDWEALTDPPTLNGLL